MGLGFSSKAVFGTKPSCIPPCTNIFRKKLWKADNVLLYLVQSDWNIRFFRWCTTYTSYTIPYPADWGNPKLYPSSLIWAKLEPNSEVTKVYLCDSSLYSFSSFCKIYPTISISRKRLLQYKIYLRYTRTQKTTKFETAYSRKLPLLAIQISYI